MKRILNLLIALGICVLAGCSAYRDGGFGGEKLRQDAVEKKEVRLADYTPFKWDRVFIYIGYWSEEQVQKEVGSSLWFPSLAFDSGVTEGDWLLVFMLGTDVQATVRDRSLRIGFEAIPGTPITRDEAVFLVGVANEHGWIPLRRRANQTTTHNAGAASVGSD